MQSASQPSARVYPFNSHLPQLQPLGHRLQAFLPRGLHGQSALNHIAVQQANPRHKVVLAQDVVAAGAPHYQPERHGWQEVTAQSKGLKGATREGGWWAGSTTWPLPSSLSHDASRRTTGWKAAPWQGSGPFPKMSGGGEEDDEEKDDVQVLQGEKTKRGMH